MLVERGGGMAVGQDCREVPFESDHKDWVGLGNVNIWRQEALEKGTVATKYRRGN